MSQWAELRHQHFVEGVPKKALARRFGLDIKTVRRALAREEPPRRAPVVRPRLLDPHREAIEAWLREDPKITAKRIGRLLEPDAGPVKERTLRQYVARLRAELFPKEAFVHRTHVPGRTMETDFGESWAIVAGELRKVKFVVNTLPHCNTYFGRAYPAERLECLLDGLAEGFAYFGGVPERVVLDNTSLVVKKVLRGRDRELTEAFDAFRGQYPFAAELCARGKGNEKGSVETGVKYVRNNVFRPMPNVESFEALNAFMLEELDHDMDRRTLPDGRTVRQAWQAEREHLRPLPAHRPETCRQKSYVANKFGHVVVRRETFSVPIEYAHECCEQIGTRLMSALHAVDVGLGDPCDRGHQVPALGVRQGFVHDVLPERDASDIPGRSGHVQDGLVDHLGREREGVVIPVEFLEGPGVVAARTKGTLAAR